MSHNLLMATKKQATDRHKPNRMARIRERVARAVETMAAEDDKKFTEMVNDLLIQALKANGKWTTRPAT